MELLPTTRVKRPLRRTSSSVPLILKRLLKFPQMDFEFAFWQMVYLVISPKIVYKNVLHHNQIKNRWARDDPAFLVLLASLLSVSAIAWGLVFGLGVVGIIKAILYMVFIDFVLVGCIISTFTWLFARCCLGRDEKHQTTEWAYAFDVHCNSFLPLFLILYIAQFILFNLLVLNNWGSLIISNFMYLIAAVWYCYGTFLGFNVLPFLKHTQLLLCPSVVFFALFILISVVGINLSEKVVGFYFGSS
ncbi:MAG: UNC-50 [Benjaminiella poitrasii]|nr:MAG: UNC-50 [Benjaminiella poitrasii]